ncbi:hypothetical protein [Ferruginibacter sp. HRS2-29]|uniref:hypothetical protein n=1 Tax=Ferruginibacter sp. HRS2-29 TaxID=2487334 RepID=UPI0020CDD5CD|nr:hypothetical protein [Ferruginibacter sp. HRS2-29]MCP9751095.1 hypothetical protein [Ferruginibacter sp. HRS2-29]
MKQMRITFLLAILVVAFSACKKDKYTTAPQIRFNSMKPNTFAAGSLNPSLSSPLLSIQLTDSEGDFGFAPGEDTSYVYVKNLSIPPFDIDSFPFPMAPEIQRKDLNAEVVIRLSDGRGILVGTPTVPTHPYIDTLRFEVYVMDFEKNKSNVIITEPVYYITP